MQNGLAYVICEESQAVTCALRARGVEAYSVDTAPTRGDPTWHVQSDAITFLRQMARARVDLIVMHPPCTYLANSGARWQYLADGSLDPVREAAFIDAVNFYRELRELARAVSPRVAIENPIMHRRAREALGKPRRQIVQPWWFGVPQFKATGWETYGLPELVPTDKLTPPKAGTDEHKKWSSVHREPPGPNRQRNRSATDPRLADVYAAQWAP